MHLLICCIHRSFLIKPSNSLGPTIDCSTFVQFDIGVVSSLSPDDESPDLDASIVIQVLVGALAEVGVCVVTGVEAGASVF